MIRRSVKLGGGRCRPSVRAFPGENDRGSAGCEATLPLCKAQSLLSTSVWCGHQRTRFEVTGRRSEVARSAFSVAEKSLGRPRFEIRCRSDGEPFAAAPRERSGPV